MIDTSPWTLPCRAWHLLLVLVLFPPAALAQDWNQWLGPTRDGVAPASLKLGELAETPKTVWKTTVGEGHSSPVVSGDRVFVLTRKGDQEVLSALGLGDGKILWQEKYAAPFTTNQAATAHGKGPFATPAVADGRVFALGIGGVLTCCDAGDGRVIWRKVFKEGEIDSREFFCGNSSSPLVDQGRLIAYRGDDSKGILGAYDVKTGDEIWSWSGDNPGYSSPIVIDVGGSKHVVTLSQTKVIGLDADSGLLLWEIPFVSQWKENVPTPVYSAPDGASRNAGLLVYSGTKRGVTAVRLDRDPESGSWAPVTVWETGEVSLYMSTPLVGDGFLFGLSQLRKGQIFCLDLASGEVAWTSKGRHGDNASFVLVGDKILSLTTEGSLIVFPRSPEGFEAIRTYGVSETPTWATPAPVDQGLLIKNQDELMLVSLKG